MRCDELKGYRKIVRKKFSDFMLLEDGTVGRKNTLVLGAVLATSSLGSLLLSPSSAFAAHSCGNETCPNAFCADKHGTPSSVCCSDVQPACTPGAECDNPHPGC